MKMYAVAIFLCVYSYQMQPAQIRSADTVSPLDKAEILRLKLDAVKRSTQAYFQARRGIQACERCGYEKLIDADRTMHEHTIQFIHGVFEMKYPDRVDCRLLTPECVFFCMNELEKRASTPQSSKLVAEFFEVKKPWRDSQELQKKALAKRKESSLSLSSTVLDAILAGDGDDDL